MMTSKRELVPGLPPGVVDALSRLADAGTDVPEYQRAMCDLGSAMAEKILDGNATPPRNAHVVTSVEDADFLAHGLIEGLENAGVAVSFSCFWHMRTRMLPEDNDIAPIVRRYEERPADNVLDMLIVVKSIISSSCVVRTGLLDTIERFNPERIVIAAPVMRAGARKRLYAAFPPAVAQKFTFVSFARDYEVEAGTGIVRPGVGGLVYERLGFGSGEMLGAMTPAIVRERRKPQPTLTSHI